MGEMVAIAVSVTGIECATPLEAEVRELRLIAEHKPQAIGHQLRPPGPPDGRGAGTGAPRAAARQRSEQ
jgi:hypothetical protein